MRKNFSIVRMAVYQVSLEWLERKLEEYKIKLKNNFEVLIFSASYTLLINFAFDSIKLF